MALLSPLICCSLQAQEIHLSPGGSDTNNGSLSAPVQSLQKAAALAREIKSRLPDDIRIILHGGWYQLSAPLLLSSQDSGSMNHRVSFEASPGERPVVSGGRRITGWSLHDASKNIWEAAAPGLTTRQLYVDGVRAVRAHLGSRPPGWLKTVSGYTIPESGMDTWKNPSDIELVFNAVKHGTVSGKWTERRAGIASINGTNIIMKQPCWGIINHADQITPTLPTDVENAYELLSKPGEWYLDRTAGKIYYIPLLNQDLSRTLVIAPVFESLICGQGTVAAPVRGIDFKGITFAYATWLRPSTGDGFPENQANMCRYPDSKTEPNRGFPQAAVSFHGGENIRFERCQFLHLGGVGLDFSGGSKNCSVNGSVFSDISSIGVRIGQVVTPLPSAAEGEDSGITVRNCYFYHVGAEYHGGVAILAGYTADLHLIHNELGHLPYTGISMGWGWGHTPSFAKNNEIAFNNIHDYTECLTDGGAIYTLDAQGASSRSSIHDNYCHDAARLHGTKTALYTDMGSAYIDIYNNTCQRLGETGCNWYSAWMKTIHDVTVRNNFTDTKAVLLKGTHCQYFNNLIVEKENWPQSARDIMEHSGLESAYTDISREDDPSSTMVTR